MATDDDQEDRRDPRVSKEQLKVTSDVATSQVTSRKRLFSGYHGVHDATIAAELCSLCQASDGRYLSRYPSGRSRTHEQQTSPYYVLPFGVH
eukprot:365923-Chlamydomonas_euryale.AAC.1